MQAVEVKREAKHRLPGVFAELLGEPETYVHIHDAGGHDLFHDFVVEAANRRWFIEVKASSSPGTIRRVAEHLAQWTGHGTDLLLVVPHMTPAGAAAAAEADLNWVDLSGNAHIRDRNFFVHVQGHPSAFRSPGRPATPFAPKSARITRVLLLDPERWWRQTDLADVTGLDDGHLSRVVRRLDRDELLEHRTGEFRPRDPGVLLDAWADAYRFDRHDIVTAHVSGAGPELTSVLHQTLGGAGVSHAFTGLPAAWALGQHARFRLASVYVEGDPRDVLERTGIRRGERGANVQLIGPDDDGVFVGTRNIDGIPIVSPPQVYLDLLNLPERASEAADHLRGARLLWNRNA